MDPKIQKSLHKLATYAKAAGLPSFLMGFILHRADDRPEIVIHREHLTTKQALMIAIQSVHTVIEMEIGTSGISEGEIKVLKDFRDEMNKIVRETDKALVAAQEKRLKKEKK